MGRFNNICIRYEMDICCIIEAILEHLTVRLYELRMLLREFIFQIGIDMVQRSVEDEAGHTKCKHILTLDDGL